MRLTEIAHRQWKEILRPGDAVVDATAGNGHDTAFLSACVGTEGKVFAIDIQAAALDATRRRIRADAAGSHAAHCDLIHGNHADLVDLIPSDMKGQLRMVVFNLGYLPGSDQQLRTNPDDTKQALAAAIDMLRSDGALSVMVYRGHPGAMEEAATVETFMNNLPPIWSVDDPICTGSKTSDGPVLWLVRGITAITAS